MKKIFTVLAVCSSMMSMAQDATTQAIIKTKTTIVSPESDENAAPPPPPSEGGGERRVFMNFGGDGETITTTYYKNGMYKTVTKNETMNTSIIRDNANKKTITLVEMMGKKQAIVATDEEQEVMRKQMDSMMQANPQFGGGGNRNNTPSTYEVSLIEESKKVGGYECKKAILIGTRGNGTKDSTTVWYCPTLKFDGLTSTGGVTGFGPMTRNAGPGGFDKLPGFPMLYERKMNRGRTMTIEVTKIEIGKEVKDSEFEIPKDYEIQSAKDIQRQMGGGRQGMQIRIGG